MPRPRKPESVRQLEGTKARVPKPPVFAVPPGSALTETPAPPDYFKGEAKELWERLSPAMIADGRLTVGDLAVFEAYCCAYCETRRHTRTIEREGWYQENSNGTVSAHPLVSVRDKARKYMADLAKSLGLTPVDRAKVIDAKPTKEAEARDDGSVAGVKRPPRLVG